MSDTVHERSERALASRPISICVATAAILRIGAFAAQTVVHPTPLFDDEQKYLDAARSLRAAATPALADPGQVKRLLHGTWAFTGPLSVATRVFGDHRAVGQLLAIGFGIAFVAAATLITYSFAGTRAAWLVGLACAVTPSQILWSTVVLRESEVWLFSVLPFGGLLLLVRPRTGTRSVLAVTSILAGQVGLLFLRQQAAVVCTFSLLAALVTLPRAVSLRLRAPLLSAVLVLPALAGIGIGGTGLIRSGGATLDMTRSALAVDSNSAIDRTERIPPVVGETKSGARCVGFRKEYEEGAIGIASRRNGLFDGRACFVGIDDNAYFVGRSRSALADLPRGLVAVLLRPWPWEARNITLLAAAIELLPWAALYVAATIGAWRRRREWPAWIYPACFVAGTVVVGALAQGNLGTAFRHRGQVLWGVALFAAAGLGLVTPEVGQTTVSASDREAD